MNADSDKSQKRAKILRAVVAFLLVDLVVASWLFVLSPRARITRTVKRMAFEFQTKNADKLISNFSVNYLDDGGNTRDAVAGIIRIIFSQSGIIKVEIKDIKVSFDKKRPGVGLAVIKGRIVYFISGAPYKTNFEDNPFGMYFTREDGAWRVTSIYGLDIPIGDLQYYRNEIKNF